MDQGWKEKYWRPRWGRTLESDGEVVIYLPHSCDEWMIGNADDAREMAAELLRLADEGPPKGDAE